MTAIDPEGDCYRIRITAITDDKILVIPFTRVPDPEAGRRVVLFQALPQKERFELILQKAVELGVSAIVPYTSAHSISLVERDSRQRKSHRWPDIILRAARQSRRRMIPDLFPTLNWHQALEMAQGEEHRVILHPEGAGPRLAIYLSHIDQNQGVALFVGPEGGFSDEEVQQASHNGFMQVNLGPRIMRTETAAIAAATLATSLGE